MLHRRGGSSETHPARLRACEDFVASGSRSGRAAQPYSRMAKRRPEIGPRSRNIHRLSGARIPGWTDRWLQAAHGTHESLAREDGDNTFKRSRRRGGRPVDSTFGIRFHGAGVNCVMAAPNARPIPSSRRVRRIKTPLAAGRTWGASVSKSAAAVRFSPPSCPIAGLLRRRMRQKLSSLGPIFAFDAPSPTGC